MTEKQLWRIAFICESGHLQSKARSRWNCKTHFCYACCSRLEGTAEPCVTAISLGEASRITRATSLTVLRLASVLRKVTRAMPGPAMRGNFVASKPPNGPFKMWWLSTESSAADARTGDPMRATRHKNQQERRENIREGKERHGLN